MSHILNGKYQIENQRNGLYRVIYWVSYPSQKVVKDVDLFHSEAMQEVENLTRKKDELKAEKQLTLNEG